MRVLLENIKEWEDAKRETTDPLMIETCNKTIKKLKRRNFFIDLLDILFKALGFLMVLASTLFLFFNIEAGNWFGALLDCAVFYYGFKVAKGLEK